jgi:glucose-6-phosphate 1-dehydrogenase
VPADSRTETFVALRLLIDNWRWRSVPFYLRTGKRLPQKLSQIAIRFRHPPQRLFESTPLADIDANWIRLQIQPDECIEIDLHAKEPGLDLKSRVLRFSTRYRESDETASDAYETLLLDVIEGDRSQFIRFDEGEESWRVVAPLLDAWAADERPPPAYAAGTWGPGAADELPAHSEHRWRV